MRHQRDNVLTEAEREKSARKCIALLLGDDVKPQEKWKVNDVYFFKQQVAFAQSTMPYKPGEPVLQWLRDMVERYVTS